jgi:hypothetical protein
MCLDDIWIFRSDRAGRRGNERKLFIGNERKLLIIVAGTAGGIAARSSKGSTEALCRGCRCESRGSVAEEMMKRPNGKMA